MPQKTLDILVVDDEPTNREVAEVILTSGGHRVTCVENGQEALDLAIDQHRHFDVILMDILMPVMDGLEAMRILRDHAETRDVPILCLSAKASGSSLAAGLAAGGDGYLTKPYKRKELLKALDDTLAKRGVIQEGEISP